MRPSGWMVPPSKRGSVANRLGLDGPEPRNSRFYARCRNGHEYGGSDLNPWCPECGVQAEAKVFCTHDHWTLDKCEQCEELPPASMREEAVSVSTFGERKPAPAGTYGPAPRNTSDKPDETQPSGGRSIEPPQTRGASEWSLWAVLALWVLSVVLWFIFK